ncbi:M14 family metallocarboxypeptidase [Thalassotalea sp. 1_MG-2023]|uniref:M14 family metallopeptidase n=1 Tax=Thalassotalea sp. 1_MG-2023 TaxID=3062680 RepID=UPI0026E3D031|nr:M14 family metallocarboxypeptidase [Thalassotalea sp. 1_MG-2023]MDO6428833.1 M14 family metallocarboxypeptidase [Thalassotalea sp. 1_MG-2023]
MQKEQDYPIGKPGIKWGPEEIAQWHEKQVVKRSYQQEVVSKVNTLTDHFTIKQYGALSYDEQAYPLLALVSHTFNANKPTVLVTGGVHGYETSGVHGALLFAEKYADNFHEQVNFIIIPCVSPWGYETINRWNPLAIDPNRSFYPQSPAQESAKLMAFIEEMGVELLAHFDLHETTDTDNSEFRPALAARDATVHDNWNIPDGFYLVANTAKPQTAFQKAIIDAVAKITHIAPADDENRLIGETIEQFGVINYDARPLGLCMGFSDAKFVTTTEVYPDSPKVDTDNCNLAQATVINAGLAYILANNSHND